MGDYTHFLACAFADMGHEVHLLTSLGDLDEDLYPVPTGVRIHRIVNGWTLGQLPGILSRLRQVRPEVVILQYTPHAYNRRGITLAINLLPLAIRVVGHARVVVNFHEIAIPLQGSLTRLLGGLWQRLMAFVTATPAHVVTAISSEWPMRLRAVGVRRPVRVIPVGSNIPLAVLDPGKRELVRKRLGAQSDAMLVASFGSAGPDRDAGLLFEAVARLPGEFRVQLVWIGKAGPLRAKLHDATVKPIWTGPLSHSDLSRTLGACDILALPYIDGVSAKRGTVAAGLQHGLPIVATSGPGSDSFFEHKINIMLAPVNDRSAFADALRQVLASQELRERLSVAARTLYESHFAWRVIAKQVSIAAFGGGEVDATQGEVGPLHRIGAERG
jgi:glycosyltransferase involved in cell wall biosynthesis